MNCGKANKTLNNPSDWPGPAPKGCLFFQPFEHRPWSKARVGGGGRGRDFLKARKFGSTLKRKAMGELEARPVGL